MTVPDFHLLLFIINSLLNEPNQRAILSLQLLCLLTSSRIFGLSSLKPHLLVLILGHRHGGISVQCPPKVVVILQRITILIVKIASFLLIHSFWRCCYSHTSHVFINVRLLYQNLDLYRLL